MTILILGIALWWAGHLFKRFAPQARAGLGRRGYGIVAGVLLVSVVLMIWGYHVAPYVPVYTPLPGMGHLNNLLMLIAVFLFGVGGTKGLLYPRLRHPMLLGVLIWSVAHLLVNGDLAAILLFGGMGLWALVEIVVINRTGPWVPPLAGRGIKGDLMNLAGTLVLFGLLAAIHIWAGHNPFQGTYG